MMSTEVAPGKISPGLIVDAMSAKENFTLESVVVTLRKLEGRDKATKMVQYVARFLYWWYASSDPALSRRAFNLFRTTQRSRKAFRLLKVLDEVVKLRQIFREASVKGTGFLDYGEALNAARCLVMGCFWTFDNLAYLTTTQTVNFGAERAQKGFSRSYTVSSALYILLGIESLRLSNDKRREVAADYAAYATDRRHVTTDCALRDSSAVQRSRQEVRLREASRRANAEHFDSWIMVLKGLADLTCAANITGVDLPMRFLGHKLNDGIIGAAGCISSLCGLYSSWPSRQEPPPLQRSSGSTSLVTSDNGIESAAPGHKSTPLGASASPG
ncbi:unnamed protein product [Ascophyllum nodosum]